MWWLNVTHKIHKPDIISNSIGFMNYDSLDIRWKWVASLHLFKTLLSYFDCACCLHRSFLCTWNRNKKNNFDRVTEKSAFAIIIVTRASVHQQAGFGRIAGLRPSHIALKRCSCLKHVGININAHSCLCRLLLIWVRLLREFVEMF